MGVKGGAVDETLAHPIAPGEFGIRHDLELFAARLGPAQADMFLQRRCDGGAPGFGHVDMPGQDHSHSMVPGGLEVMS